MTNLIAIIILFLFPVESNHLKYRLPDNYKPKELSILSLRSSFLTSTQLVDSRIAKQVEQLVMDAQADGLCLVVSSGYRSFSYQQKLYNRAEDKSLVMKPGYSEHQTGLAVDFQACPYSYALGGIYRNDQVERPELTQPFGDLPEYQWLLNNAKKYGIEQSYPNESWHYKFMIEK